MKNLKRVLLFFFVLININGFAQKPGYLGKQINVGAEFSYGFLGTISTRYGVYADYILNRKIQIGIDYFHYAGKLFFSEYGEDERIKANALMFNFRFYRVGKKGAIAPIGKYFDFGISYNEVKYIPPSGLVLTADNFIVDGGGFVQFHFSPGIQTVFFNCISADCGIRFGLPPISMNSKDLFLNLLYMNGANFYTRIGYLL